MNKPSDLPPASQHVAEYQVPTVWQAPAAGDDKWAHINRPVSGATHQKELAKGKHPLQLYSLGTPNGQKVTIMLEELLALGEQGAEYDAHLINIGQGEQFSSGFVAVNPNSKIPALLDCSLEAAQRVFESGNILLYLAEKFGQLLPKELGKRTEVMNWLFWLQGSAPYLGGGFGHFYAYAPIKIEYAINRFTMETKRQLDVLDKQLAEHEYIGGSEYSIADIAIWPWYGCLVLGETYGAAEFLDANAYGHVQRWAKQIAKRPAVQRGRIVNRTAAQAGPFLEHRHTSADIDRVLNK